MKRLFGLIGIIYLATLTAVFYFKSPLFSVLVIAFGAAVIAFGVFKRFRKDRYMFRTLLISGVTILLATLNIFLYQNYFINPIIENYSDKEISVKGYVCDEIKYNSKSAEYLIQTEEIDSSPVRTKLKFYGYSENEIREFDRVELNVKAYSENSNQSVGHGILLQAYETKPENIKGTGESKFSLYKYAITARKDIRKALGRLMPEESASMCRAILLGDKDALSSDIRNSFSKTGTSYLIVVSGLHLSIALILITSLLKAFTKRRLTLCIGAIIAVIMFASLTGYNYSVIRAAITVIIYEVGRIILRRSDPLNSLGFAALAMTILNPCSVGDLGMLMSFSATMGIVLWSDKIESYLTKKTRVNKIESYKIRSVFRFFFNLISVSISAAIWILPISILAFGKISPLVIIIAFITEPIASSILMLALIASILYLFPIAPIITQLLGFFADILCRLLIQINRFFAGLPITSIKADGAAVYIWLAVTALLVLIGYIIKAKRTYVIASINISAGLVMILTAVSILLTDTSGRMIIYQSGEGVSIEVRKENNISFISLSGNAKVYNDISTEIIESDSKIDNIIIPNSNYSTLLPHIIKDYDITNIISDTDSAEDVEYLTSKQPYVIEDKSIQTVNLNAEDSVTIISNNVIYQYIRLGNKDILFIPKNSDIKKLPAEYRAPDFFILDGIPKNCDLLSGGEVYFTGENSTYYKEKLEEITPQFDNVNVINNSKLEIKSKE